ncbi:MAG: hypothetical protein CBB65_07060 [Hyphomonadaceae bacterium TMED5]|nr:hypothetical protein [Ponticaulis sp.]OUX99832.1 MAG: hypothetical protein CBB65_07060 [Hyphomonadaceae bacterium TMED5]|tara:strand:+ start:146089 stop:146568 length:480 start_codon:yes stop_codon:yes gene_type:complete
MVLRALMTTADTHSELDAQIEAIRRFNRFYTRELGLLRKTFLETSWTLGEMRVLYEIRVAPGISARDICEKLHLDPAYLSRLVARFELKDMVRRQQSESDARQLELYLTPAGEQQVAITDERQRQSTARLLKRLSAEDRAKLTQSMTQVMQLLSAQEET